MPIQRDFKIVVILKKEEKRLGDTAIGVPIREPSRHVLFVDASSQESPAVKQASGPEPLLPSLLFFAGGSRGVYRGGTVIRVHLERNHRSLRGRKCSFSVRLDR